MTDRELLENIARLVQMEDYEEIVLPIVHAYVMHHFLGKEPHEKLEKQFFSDNLKKAEEYLETAKGESK